MATFLGIVLAFMIGTIGGVIGITAIYLVHKPSLKSLTCMAKELEQKHE